MRRLIIMEIKKAIVPVLLVLTWLVNSAEAGINNVSIFPENPNMFDAITIIVSGGEPAHPVLIESTNFEKVGASLLLDVYVNIGVLQEPTLWSHYEDIGTLSAGMYDLTVREFVKDSGLTDTHSINFEVIPEPAAIFFLLGSLPIIRNASKKGLNCYKHEKL
jgi:hypothetical protein